MAEITREQIAAIREAALYEAAAVCSAYSDWATEKINEGCGDLFGIVGNTADDCAERILALIKSKGGDADERSSNNARHATSPGVTAGASETQEALYDLDGFSSCGDHLTEVPLVTRMRTVCGNAAALIRRLETYVRKPSVYMDAYYDQRVREEIDDRYRFSDDDETYIETWEAAKAMREALESAESRATAAEAEVERLRADKDKAERERDEALQKVDDFKRVYHQSIQRRRKLLTPITPSFVDLKKKLEREGAWNLPINPDGVEAIIAIEDLDLRYEKLQRDNRRLMLYRQQAEARVAALEKALGEAKEALRPFASASHSVCAGESEDYIVCRNRAAFLNEAVLLSSDFRRARSALEGSK